MTYNGSFEPLSRRGMECNASPLLQMSFESSLKFLRDASVGGKWFKKNAIFINNIEFMI